MLDRRRVMIGAAMAASATRTQGAAPRLSRLVSPADPKAVLGVAAIARGPRGRETFAEAAGLAVRGDGERRRERPFGVDDPVRVASISKLAAMTGFMRLVEAGRADLDADVSDALGFRLRHPAFPDVPITTAMLASHASGLRDSASYPLPLGRRLQDAFTPGTPAYENGAWFAPAGEPPGRFFAYANTNFAVLAQLMERLTGERFDRLMTRLVFEPLGLDCGYNWSGVSQAKRDRAAAACRFENGVWAPKVDAEVPPAPQVRVVAAPDQPQLTADDYRLGENGWVFSAQGGLRASARDLDRLAQLFARGGGVGGRRLLQAATVERMQTPRWVYDPAQANGDTYGKSGLMRAYGLSVHALTGRAGPDGDAVFGPGSEQWRGHIGQAYGLLSGLWWNIRDRRTVVYVINGTPPDPPPGRRSALTLWEEEVIGAALGR
jgi:CubicO group peptidase (beta-lactamase class C family)